MSFFFTKFATVLGVGGTASTEDQRDTDIIDIDIGVDVANDASAVDDAVVRANDKGDQGQVQARANEDQGLSDAPPAKVDDSLHVKLLNGKRQALPLTARDYGARQTNATDDTRAAEKSFDGAGVVQGANEKAHDPEEEEAVDGKDVQSVLNQEIQGRAIKELLKKSIESPVASSTAAKAAPESSSPPPVANSAPNQAPKLALLGPFVAGFLASQGITSSQEFLSTTATKLFRGALVAYVAAKKSGQQWSDGTAKTKISRWKRDVRHRIAALRDLPSDLNPAFQVFDPKVREFLLTQKILSPDDLSRQSTLVLGESWANWSRENASMVISNKTGRQYVIQWRDSVARQPSNGQAAGLMAVATAASKTGQGADTARPAAEAATMQFRDTSVPLPVALDTFDQDAARTRTSAGDADAVDVDSGSKMSGESVESAVDRNNGRADDDGGKQAPLREQRRKPATRTISPPTQAVREQQANDHMISESLNEMVQDADQEAQDVDLLSAGQRTEMHAPKEGQSRVSGDANRLLAALATGQNALMRPQATRPDSHDGTSFARARRCPRGTGTRDMSNQDVAHAGTSSGNGGSAVNVDPVVADPSCSTDDDDDAEQGDSRRKRRCTAATRFRPEHNAATLAACNQNASGFAGDMEFEGTSGQGMGTSFARARRCPRGTGTRDTSNQDGAQAGTSSGNGGSAVNVEPVVADPSCSTDDDDDAEHGGSRRKRRCTAATLAAGNIQDASGIAGDMEVEVDPSSSKGDSSAGSEPVRKSARLSARVSESPPVAMEADSASDAEESVHDSESGPSGQEDSNHRAEPETGVVPVVPLVRFEDLEGYVDLGPPIQIGSFYI